MNEQSNSLCWRDAGCFVGIFSLARFNQRHRIRTGRIFRSVIFGFCPEKWYNQEQDTTQLLAKPIEI